MRLAIVGSRSIGAVDLDKHIPVKPDLVVSGGAAGVDTLAEDWAKRNGVRTLVIRPDWARYGRSAGFRRNPVIVDNADEVLALWDGASKGTLHTVEYARGAGKPVRLVKVNAQGQTFDYADTTAKNGGRTMTVSASALAGEITIGSLRQRERKPNTIAIRVDRTSGSAIGNPFHMRNESERNLVCDRYRDWLHGKIDRNDPRVLDELNRILDIVRQGKNVELLCWCAPKKCHAETIKAWLLNEIEARR